VKRNTNFIGRRRRWISDGKRFRKNDWVHSKRNAQWLLDKRKANVCIGRNARNVHVLLTTRMSKRYSRDSRKSIRCTQRNPNIL